MKARTTILWLVGLLVLASLACSQAGEILTPEEATARAEAAFGPVIGSDDAVNAEFKVGDQATLAGKGFLVNLMDEPGGKISGGQERGAEVEVTSSAVYEGEIWYRVKANTGEGWIKAANLEPLEIEEEAAPATTYQAGDEVYLAGKSFLVSLMGEAGGNRMIAGQERGTLVIIIETADVEGVTWYLIDAPTGQGWVPEENLTTEAP